MSDVPNIGGEPQSTANDVASDVNSAWLEEEGKVDGSIMEAPPQPHYQGQPRDEQGRWTAEQQAAAEAAQVQQQGQQQQQASYPQPPGGWSPAAKAEYMRLAQQYPDHPIVQAVQQREAEVNAGFQIYQGLKPYIEQAQQAGTTLPDAIANWMQAENILATDFYNGIGWLCQRFGVNPEQLIAQYYGQPQQQQQNDPTMRYLQQLQQQVQGLYQQQEQQQNAAINQELQAFKDDGHIWFDNLEPAMAEIFKFERSQGRDLTLQEAYEAAAWGHPETRAILLEHFYGNGQSRGQGQPQPPSDRGRSLPPGSPIPGVSAQRKPKESVYDEISTLYDEQSGI
jgi:hypothetical protein